MVAPPAALPGVRGIHHVAFAVRDLDASLERWLALTSGEVELRAAVPEFGVEAASIEWSGGTLLELISPLGSEGGVAKFLESRGEGFHHVAFAVASVAACLEAARIAGLRAIDGEPRTGLHGTPVAFLHPSAAGGTLVELVEVPLA